MQDVLIFQTRNLYSIQKFMFKYFMNIHKLSGVGPIEDTGDRCGNSHTYTDSHRNIGEVPFKIKSHNFGENN